VKGKPWSTELEKELKDLVEAKTSLKVIAAKLDKPEEAVRQKIRRLGLEVVEHKKIICSTSSKPEELPSVEETLKTLSAALKTLETPGLDKCEILRLRGIIAGAKVYKELLVDYIDYRGIEAELLKISGKYEELSKKVQGVPAR
jgi:hypothetical protein